MFKISEPLITSIEFNGNEYELEMAFDNVINALNISKEPELTDYDKGTLFVELMTDISDEELTVWPIKEIETFYQKILTLIQGKQSKPILDDLGNVIPQPKKAETIDFEQDAESIYAGFIQAYGIDLIDEQGKLHWQKFSALLNSLPDDTAIKKTIDIRSTDISKIKDKEERKRIKKLKQDLSLDKSNSDREEETYG